MIPWLSKLECVVSSGSREYIGVMLNMDQESRDNNGNKSDMRPASKFQGLRIKFHHL